MLIIECFSALNYHSRAKLGVSRMKAYFVLLWVVVITIPGLCFSSNVFRDSEIENVVKEVSAPLFNVANVDINAVRVFIVDDDTVNAYVTPENYVFIHRGLLRFSKNPEVVVGVIAHEIGHMAQYHVIKREGERRSSALAESLGRVLGMVASVIVDPKVGNAIMAGSSTISQRKFLAYSRTQEEIADQLALEYLDAAGYSHDGLSQVLRHFKQREAQYAYIDEYVSSHPLSEQRLIKMNSYKKKREVVGFTDKARVNFARIVEKTEAFLVPIDLLKNRELSPYMKAIVDSRNANLQESLGQLDVLISDSPGDPYLREIRAQILYKLGNIDACIEDYKVALDGLPDDVLIKLQLAQALIIKDPGKALPYLEQVSHKERENPFVWQQLALVYGRMGKRDMLYFALANRYFFEGNRKKFFEYIQLSKKHFDKGSSQLQVIADLEEMYGVS